MIILIFFAIGIVTGVLAGLFGLSGGVILVPALAFVFERLLFPPDLVMHVAAGTSLAIMIVTTLSALLSHYRHCTIWKTLFWCFVPGIIVGVFAGVMLAAVLSSYMLSMVFAVVLLLLALRVLYKVIIPFRDEESPIPCLPGGRSCVIVSLFVGMFAGMLGIGAGSMIVPYLLYYRVKMSTAAGTACAFSFVIAVLGTIVVIFTGWSKVMIPWSTGYVYWPAVLGVGIASMLSAPFGSRLSRYIPSRGLQAILGVVLCLLSLHLFISM